MSATFIKEVGIQEGAEAVIETLKSDGVVILKHGMAPSDVAAAAFDLEQYLRRTPTGQGAFYGFNTRRCGALVAKSKHFADLATHSVVLPAVTEILEAHCDCIQLNLTQAIRIEPNESPQFLHRDDELFPLPGERFETMVNALWAISEFSVENGGTRVIPGSHKWPRDREPQANEILQAEMKPGDVLVYLGSVLHGGGANHSPAPRTGAVISYNLGWLKQTENFYLSIPWETARRLPERLQRLIGYQLHRPNVGWVEGRDPLEWLRAGRPEVMAASDALTEDQVKMVGEAMADPARFAAHF
ncbi:phytanoyl-CoA dioxygenase family protein, partial [Glycocaulis profundi]